MSKFKKLLNIAFIILVVGFLLLRPASLYASKFLRVPMDSEAKIRQVRIQCIKEFLQFWDKREGRFKSKNPWFNIVSRLLEYRNSFNNMQGEEIIELGPGQKTDLIEFFRSKGIDAIGIDAYSSNDFVLEGNYFHILLLLSDQYQDNTVGVIYTKNGLGSGLNRKGIELSELSYRDAIVKLFYRMNRILKDDGLVIIDSMHFMDVHDGYGIDDWLRESDFMKTGFELLEADGKNSVYVFKKMAPADKPFKINFDVLPILEKKLQEKDIKAKPQTIETAEIEAMSVFDLWDDFDVRYLAPGFRRVRIELKRRYSEGQHALAMKEAVKRNVPVEKLKRIPEEVENGVYDYLVGAPEYPDRGFDMEVPISEEIEIIYPYSIHTLTHARMLRSAN